LFAIIGFVGGLAGAWLSNLTLKIVGGLEVEIEMPKEQPQPYVQQPQSPQQNMYQQQYQQYYGKR
jgi:hypothetical protein